MVFYKKFSKKEKKKKKKEKKRIKKVFRFKFRRRRFKFKRLRKHTKTFRLKKKKLRKENFTDLSIIYYYNYISRINKVKRAKTSFKWHFGSKSFFLENFNLKNNKYVFFDKNNLIFSIIEQFNKNTVYINRSLQNVFFAKRFNFLKLNFFKFKFRFKKRRKSKKKRYKPISKFFKKSLHNYIYIFINNYYGDFLKKMYEIYFNFYIVFFSLKQIYFNFFKKIRLMKKKKKKIFRWKRRKFFYKNRFFKIKRKYKYKTKFLFYKKFNFKKKKIGIFREFYKILFKKLLYKFKLKPSIFMFTNLSKLNVYYFLKTKNDKNSLINFIKKKYKFFNLIKKNSINYLSVYNNHTPIYTLGKNYIKEFKKIFKSFFGKKFKNHLYYYILPALEFFLKKKVLIKSHNLNIYKKGKNKKKYLYIKLMKIFKRNKSLVISRSITFNIFELCEIVIYTFYRKDSYLLLNWFLRNFKNIHFTGHKNFLIFFKMIINDIFESYKNTLRIKGIYFVIKGKVGVTSNAKKKTVKFVIGSLYKSNKSKKIDFQQSVVKSISGSLGVSIMLTY